MLEPVDDVMKDLLAKNGAVSPLIEYLGKVGGHWVAIPATPGSQIKGPCGRIDLFKQHAGLDLVKMYPAGAAPDKALSEAWTWDAFLDAATKCHKAGFPFGVGLGRPPTRSTRWARCSRPYGAELVDAKGNITVKSDAVKQVLEYMKKLVPFLPPDVFAWDDASNNKWLVSGKGALIMNPPSAWAVAKRDNPKVAEQCWTFLAPKGSKRSHEPGPIPRIISDLEVLQEQGGGQEPHAPHLRAFRGREDGRGEPGLRHPGLRQAERLQDLGRGGAAQGHAVQLSAQARPDPVDCGRHTGSAQDRRSRFGNQATLNHRWSPSARRAAIRSTRRSPGPPPSYKASCASEQVKKFLRRKSTIAFAMALPLILIIALLVLYPALYSIHLAMLNKGMEHFVGLDNFAFLFTRETF